MPDCRAAACVLRLSLARRRTPTLNASVVIYAAYRVMTRLVWLP